MGTINRKPVAEGGDLTDVYLKTDPGQGFTPADRIVGDAGNFRTVGPILAATSGDRTFKRVRIPLRPFAADSSAIGKTLFLAIINAATGVVVNRRTLKIAAGMTEAVFEGPFTIPAGQQHGYVYGVEEGDWNSYLYLFYGNGSPYGAPNSSVASLYSDSVTPQVGQGWGAPSQTGKHRAILCEADGVTKNVHGPLDPSDFPVVTSLDQLLVGQAALLDNGTDPPRLVRRRLDGNVPPGLSPTVFGRAAKRQDQTLSAGAWTRVIFEAVSNAAGGALTTTGFTCQVAGVYSIAVSALWNGSQGLQAGDYINVAVRKNNVEALKIAEENIAIAGIRLSTASGALELAVGDVVEVWAYCAQSRTLYGSASDITTWSLRKGLE